MQTYYSSLSRTSAFHFAIVQLDCHHCVFYCSQVRISLHCSIPTQSIVQQRVLGASHCIAIVLLSRHNSHCTENSLLSSTGILRLKYPSTPSHFHSSSQITHNNSHTTASTPTNSTQFNSTFQQEHAVQDQHVFHQEHPRRFCHRCSRQHSSWAYGHGYASPIRQSQQQPSRGRRFKLPMQIHEQHWRNSHKHGYRLHTETLFHRRGYPWRWVMPSLSYHRQPCDQELQMDGHSLDRGRLPSQKYPRQHW